MDVHAHSNVIHYMCGVLKVVFDQIVNTDTVEQTQRYDVIKI